MPDPHVGLLVAMATPALLGLVASLTVLRGSDLTRLMVTLGVGAALLELANKLDWLTGGTDGIQGLVFSPVLGKFEFDLAGRVASYYSLACCWCCSWWRGASSTRPSAARSRRSATTACAPWPSASRCMRG
jgi:branched-chain amino acid transport system permease protein